MALIEVKVPDIGDFKDVAVIELLVKPGDRVKLEQSLVTVESDKASMEIPSSAAGVIKELKVKIGDTVNEGSLLLLLEGEGVAAAAPSAPAAPAAPSPVAVPAPAAAPVVAAGPAANYAGGADLECDLLVLGAGPGGYSAAFRAADLGMKVVLVERYASLGGVCLNVGCIPSKALLHVAAVMDEVEPFRRPGRELRARRRSTAPSCCAHKNKVVGKLTGGLGAMAKMRKVTVVRGMAVSSTPHLCRSKKPPAARRTRPARRRPSASSRCIIAAGSQAMRLPFLPDDPRIVDSTGALELRAVPKRMLIVGGGIIGLEMGTVYSTLGARLDVVEMLDGLMQGADRDLVKVWQKMNAPRFDHVMLKTKTVRRQGHRRRHPGQLRRRERTERAAALRPGAAGRGPQPQRQEDRRRQGRRGRQRARLHSGGSADAHQRRRTSSPLATSSASRCWRTRRCTRPMSPPKSRAGDSKALFDARVIPSVAYTDPEVAWVGLTEDEAKAQGLKVKKGLFPWTASGRAIANGRDEGFTKLLFDDSPEAHGHGRILGGGIVGTHAGDMIGEVALAIEMGADAVDIGKTIHPHPTLGESIGMAAEVAHGSCTDLPPARK